MYIVDKSDSSKREYLVYRYRLDGNISGKTETYNGSTNTTAYTYDYNTFGTNEYFNNVNTSNKWGYCDQLRDFETGNYYMRARYYNPESGRFITEDPIKDSCNWYSYCGGNPVLFLDINGLDKEKFLDVTEYSQNYDSNCWAAALSMSIAYETKNNKDVQDDIVRIVEGIEGDIDNSMVSDKEWHTVNSKLGEKSVDTDKYEPGTEPIVYESFDTMPVMENLHIEAGELKQAIIDEIDRAHTLIVLYNGKTGGHYVVITGYTLKSGKMTVQYNDPGEEGNVKKSASIDEMKGKLPNTGYNYMATYSVRKNVERYEG